MKNAEIVRDLPKLSFLKHEQKSLEAQIKGLEKQRRRLEEEINTLEDVTEVFEGVALHVNDKNYAMGPALDVHPVDNTERRYAEVYPNAHNEGKDFGLKLRSYGQAAGGGGEDWRGCGWAYADAVLVGKCWAAHGTKPADAFEIMCKLRHKLDPKGKAQKRRRLAFEAAFMAGHRELAGDLLVGRARCIRVASAMKAATGTP